MREAGGLFIADEVQPDFGRTGGHMWGFQRHGVAPDLATLGKPMGNGFPIGAVVGRHAAMERFGGTARYSNTLAGTTVGIATADAVLRVLQRDRIPQNALAMGERLASGLEQLPLSRTASARCAMPGLRQAGSTLARQVSVDVDLAHVPVFKTIGPSHLAGQRHRPFEMVRRSGTRVIAASLPSAPRWGIKLA